MITARTARWWWLAAGALLLVGCSGAERAGRDGGAVTAASGGGGTVAPISCSPGETDGDLDLYIWSQYMDPALLERFEAETGVTVREDFYPSNEEMLARLQGGAAGYDLIVPSDYMVAIMIADDLLAPLDHGALPNLDNLAAEWRDLPFDPGNRYSVPYQWGTTGLAVDTAVVTDPAPTWGLLFDEAMSAPYSGRISMLDDPREAMGAALYYLGLDANTTDEDDLKEASDLIAGARDRIVAFDSDAFEDLLLQGETVIAQGYSGNLFQAFVQADDPGRYRYLLPEEGATRWVDNMVVPADADHPCSAHALIDFMLDAEHGAQLSQWTRYGTPNAAALDLLPDELTDDPDIYPPEDVLGRLSLLRDTGPAEILFNDYFLQAKG